MSSLEKIHIGYDNIKTHKLDMVAYVLNPSALEAKTRPVSEFEVSPLKVE